ncbi:hypothetical protein [Salinispora pacifica]|uniref:hypothetical protein n=1 Tax=Salinispora pacifica TaxID=351187 RepID=UPI001EE1DD8A|nr:hypothetical protein [Salinispora pacifica]
MIEGRGPSPTLVLAYVQRLPDTSLTVALASGGRDRFGWGQDRYLLADLFDAITTNTRATGNWQKGKAPKFDAYPRPRSKSQAGPKKPASVADIYKRLQRR